MKYFTTFILILIILMGLKATNAATPPGPIKHFVVLMMENRAFDHMLGWLKLDHGTVNGIKGNEWNPWNVSETNSRKVFISKLANDKTPDPDHSVPGTSLQIYSTKQPVIGHSRATMLGFVQSATERFKDVEVQTVMGCWESSKVPVISALANHFTLFDAWHSSIPGPTHPNRLFFHSGTSNGEAFNNQTSVELGFPQKPLFQVLDENGYNWRNYFINGADAFYFKYTRQAHLNGRSRPMDEFERDLKNGDLADYTFINPSYVSSPSKPANDQHPDHLVSQGEAFIKRVYEALRSSDFWNSSALLLTYDEHGGFYDHVSPPDQNIQNPDGKISASPPFDFRRLGIRVPTILISPFASRQVIHAPTTPSSHYDHTSFIHTISRMWDMQSGQTLTKRVSSSAHFQAAFDRSTPRVDCPLTLPNPYIPPSIISNPSIMTEDHKKPTNDLGYFYLELLHAALGKPFNLPLQSSLTQGETSKLFEELISIWKSK